jgi:hypothetical protein
MRWRRKAAKIPLLLSFRHARETSGPGIQRRIQRFLLDSGFAAFGRARNDEEKRTAHPLDRAGALDDAFGDRAGRRPCSSRFRRPN